MEGSKAKKMLAEGQAGALPARGGLAARILEVQERVKAMAVEGKLVVGGVLRKPRGKRSEAARRREEVRKRADPVGYAAAMALRALKMREPGCRLTAAWLEPRVKAGVCEATGVEFRGDESLWSPVIVRVLSKGPWTPENCKLVCAAWAPFMGMPVEKRRRIAKALETYEGV